MDDNPERKLFLDKLLGYMEEIRKPVTACPTISKQPLDLYRLYTYVKERSGFMEVCKVNFVVSERSSAKSRNFPPQLSLCLLSALSSTKKLLKSINPNFLFHPEPWHCCINFRLPKIRLGRMSPDYWALERAAVQLIRSESITSKVFCHTNVNLTAVALIPFPSSSRSRLARKRKHPNRLQCLRPDQATHKTLSHRLARVVRVWMAMETIQISHILSRLVHLSPANINVLHRKRTHNKRHILQV